MRRSAAAVVLLVAGLALAGCQHPGGTRTFRLTVGGFARTLLVHAPDGHGAALPVVLALHGNLGDGQGMRSLTHLDEVADADGFIVVYPDGYQRSWADARGVTAADRAGVDDVAFLGAVIDLVDKQYRADPARTFVTGISNGAMMAHRLGCDLSGRIAAIAPDAGGMSAALAGRCHPTRPVPVLDIQGTADPFVPYDGGEVRGGRGRLLSATDTAALWAKLDGCATPPVGTAPIRSWCGGQVQLYTVVGGGHTWPGGVQYLPVSVVGKTSRDFDASRVVADFFTAAARGTSPR